jgi:hypothetical protein
VHAHVYNHLADVMTDLCPPVTCWPITDVRSCRVRVRVIVCVLIVLG